MNTALATRDDLDDELLAAALDEVTALDTTLEAERCEASFHAFVQAAWSLVEPGQLLVDTWYLRKLCAKLERTFYKRPGWIGRLIGNVPPGTGKSLIVMVLYPAWVWTKDANKSFLCAAYGQHLSTRDNLRCRRLVESDWYQARWPHVQLADDQNNKTRYNTTKGGWRVATSPEGVGTGEHPDFILLDDAMSASQAESAAERAKVNSWVDNTVLTRLGHNPAIIVIGQRLHVEDVPGHLLTRGGWTLVRWPMRFETCHCPDTAPTMNPDEERRCALHKADPTWTPDPDDERTVEGELLSPVLFPEAKVAQLELDLNPFGAAGQLQQRPSPVGGGLFRREWFHIADKVPVLARRVRGWDTAGTEAAGDYTVGAKVSEEFEWRTENGKRELKSTGKIFVEDIARDQTAGVDALIKRTADLDGKDVPVREEREGGASGKGTIAARRKLLLGWDYDEVILGANKIARAKAFRSQAEGGHVHLVRGPWNEAFLQELAAFPTGKHDDQVDGVSCAFNAMLLEPPPRKASYTW